LGIKIERLTEDIDQPRFVECVLEVIAQAKGNPLQHHQISKALTEPHPIKFGRSSGQLTGVVRDFTDGDIMDALEELRMNNRINSYRNKTMEEVGYIIVAPVERMKPPIKALFSKKIDPAGINEA
jgi:hypothetical protein